MGAVWHSRERGRTGQRSFAASRGLGKGLCPFRHHRRGWDGGPLAPSRLPRGSCFCRPISPRAYRAGETLTIDAGLACGNPVGTLPELAG